MKRRLASLTVAVVTGSAGVGLLDPSAGAVVPPEEDYGAASAGCVVSATRVARPPAGHLPYSGWVDDGGLWALDGAKATIVGVPGSVLPNDADPGVVYFGIKPSGGIAQKFPWLRSSRARGNLSVKGQTIPPGLKPVGRGSSTIEDRQSMWFRAPSPSLGQGVGSSTPSPAARDSGLWSG